MISSKRKKNREEKEKIKLLYMDHKYKNMQSLIREIRVMDKSVLYTSGILFSLIFSGKIDVYWPMYLLPLFVSLLHEYKVKILLKEYYKQKRLYKSIDNQLGEITEEGKEEPSYLNKNYYKAIIVLNGLVGILCICF